MVPRGQRADARQRLFVPDLARGVVGVAQDHQGGLGVRQLGVQVRPVDAVGPVRIGQGAFQHQAAVVLDGMVEDVVHRGQGQHLLGRGGQFAHHAGDGGHHAGGKDQPLPLQGKAVAGAPPAHDGVVPFGGHVGIAVHRVGGPPLHGGGDLRRGGKVHIGDPHGQFAVGHVPLGAVGAPAVDQGVKIVGHGALLIRWSRRRRNTAPTGRPVRRMRASRPGPR